MKKLAILNHPSLFVLLTVSFLLAVNVARASTNTWVGTTSTNWSAAGAWVSGAAPVSGATNVLEFDNSGSASYTATNNIASSPFQLNGFVFNSTSSGLITISAPASGNGSLSLVANSGTSPTIDMEGTGNVSMGNLTLSAQTTINGAGAGVLTQTGILTGAGGLVMSGEGALILPQNTNTGFSGGVVLNSGTLGISGNSGIWGSNTSLTINGGVIDNTSGDSNLPNTNNTGYESTLSSLAVGLNSTLDFAGSADETHDLIMSGAVSLNKTTTAVSRNIEVDGGTLEIDGVVSNGNGVATVDLHKTGNGRLILKATNTYTGITYVDAGTLTLGGASGVPKALVFANNTTFQWGFNNTVDISASPHGVTLSPGAVVTFDTFGGYYGGCPVSGRDATFSAAFTAASTSGIIKAGMDDLTMNAANTYGAGTTVNGGDLISNKALALGLNMSTNPVTVNGPGGLVVNVTGGIGNSQPLFLNASANALPSIGGFALPSSILPTTVNNNTGAYGGIYIVNFSPSSGIDNASLDTLFNGFSSSDGSTPTRHWFLGTTTGATFSAASLAAASDNNYRLTAGGGSFDVTPATLVISNAALTGANGLIVGATNENGSGARLGGIVRLDGANTYSGATTINCGTLLMNQSASGIASSSSISISTPTSYNKVINYYDNLSFGTSSLVEFGLTASGTSQVTRINSSAPINLNNALFEFEDSVNNTNSNQQLGAITLRGGVDQFVQGSATVSNSNVALSSTLASITEVQLIFGPFVS